MRALLVIVVIYIIWRILKRAVFFKLVRFQSPYRQGYARSQARTAPESERLVQDAVCGSYVPLSLAIRVDRDGTAEYFCSPECRDKFVAQGFSPD